MADQVFFWLSKIVWGLISPDLLLVTFTLGGILMLFIGALKKAKFILGFVGLSMLAITLLPMGQWLLSPLEKRFPIKPELPEKIDGIILLGGAENINLSFAWGQVEINHMAERYVAFLNLRRAYPGAVHLFTGGSGNLKNQEIKGAHVAQELFRDIGIDVSKILFESESKNTYENGMFSKGLVQPQPDEAWVLITTARHMPRAFGVFEQLNWPVIPYPVDHYTYPENKFKLTLNFLQNLEALNIAVKEWLGLFAYYITGKTSAIFPPDSNMENTK